VTESSLTRTAASGAVEALGWRYLLDAFATTVAVASLDQALQVAAAAVTACGPDADGHLRATLRPDGVELVLQTAALGRLTSRDVDLAHRVTEAVRAVGPATRPAGAHRAVQSLEIGIDALDIPAIRPFWRAVLAYTDEPGRSGPEDALVDPTGQGPAVWFQQMDAPRPQRNRVHLDLTVPHDEAEARRGAALAAGGVLVSDAAAPAFWVLADAEGNEVCICTWQGRDPVPTTRPDPA
jgi:4a-hydroxytetrahydrobiopterin dehydratase